MRLCESCGRRWRGSDQFSIFSWLRWSECQRRRRARWNPEGGGVALELAATVRANVRKSGGKAAPAVGRMVSERWAPRGRRAPGHNLAGGVVEIFAAHRSHARATGPAFPPQERKAPALDGSWRNALGWRWRLLARSSLALEQTCARLLRRAKWPPPPSPPSGPGRWGQLIWGRSTSLRARALAAPHSGRNLSPQVRSGREKWPPSPLVVVARRERIRGTRCRCCLAK